MGETSHAKLWAIIAPLAALAGLAFLHYNRKKSSGAEATNGIVKKVTRSVDPKIHNRVKSESKTVESSVDDKILETKSEQNLETLIENNSPKKRPKTTPDNKEEIIITYEPETQITQSCENELEIVEENLENEPEIVEEPIKLLESVEVLEVRASRADSGFKTMNTNEQISTNHEIENRKPEEPKATESDITEPSSEENIKNSPCRENGEQLVFEYEDTNLDSSSHEWVEVKTAPAIMTEQNYDNLFEKVRSSSESEDVNKSYDILNGTSIDIEENSIVTEDCLVDQFKDLSTITEHSEEKITESRELTPGTSGAVLGVFNNRARTESERIEEADWTNSPIMKLKTTPVFEERANKSKQVTPNNNEDQRKRPSKLRVKQKTNLKARIEACEDDRDSTPTPTDQSSQKKSRDNKRRKSTKRKKKDQKQSSGTGSSTVTNGESENKETSSDSGTHTDDNVERYMEISGFPTEMIGALIGKAGKNIKKIQQESGCKIVIKDYPAEGGQYISVEGKSKHIKKAINILREKFPDIKLSDMTRALDQSPGCYQPNSPEFEQVAYDYNEMYQGSINNIPDQIELVEGVPVEVQVTSLGPSYNELWLQPYTHPTHEKFARLEASMAEFYNRDVELSCLTEYLELGSYGSCLHHTPDEITGIESSKWYRIQVIQYPDDLTATVLYLDFGGYASVPIEMLRKIMQEFLPSSSRCPFQAIHAELEGLTFNENFQSEKIPELSVHLHDIICKAPPNSFQAEVIGFDEVNYRPSIKLTYGESKILLNKVYGETVSMLDYRTSL